MVQWKIHIKQLNVSGLGGSNLDLAIDLLDKQTVSKEAHPGVLENVIEKTEEYNRFIKSIIG